jgi:hypothetical protein
MSNGIRAKITHHLELMSQGRMLEGFELYYHPQVVMSENAVPDDKRIGKEANRQHETWFANNAEWHGAKVGRIIVDEDNNTSAYEMWLDMTVGGQRVTHTQTAVQTWKDGQIIDETFYYTP